MRKVALLLLLLSSACGKDSTEDYLKYSNEILEKESEIGLFYPKNQEEIVVLLEDVLDNVADRSIELMWPETMWKYDMPSGYGRPEHNIFFSFRDQKVVSHDLLIQKRYEDEYDILRSAYYISPPLDFCEDFQRHTTAKASSIYVFEEGIGDFTKGILAIDPCLGVDNIGGKGIFIGYDASMQGKLFDVEADFFGAKMANQSALIWIVDDNGDKKLLTSYGHRSKPEIHEKARKIWNSR